MNRFPKEAPMWQAMDTDYNKRMDEADAPLFVQPTELGSAELIDGDVLSPIMAPMDPAINKSNYMPPDIEEADDQNGPVPMGGTKDIQDIFAQKVAEGYGPDNISSNVNKLSFNKLKVASAKFQNAQIHINHELQYAQICQCPKLK